MDKIKIVTLMGLLLISGFFVAFACQANHKFMSIKQAEKKWGSAQFDAERFKKGNAEVRASMVVSLIKSKAFIGKPVKDVREILGDPTGYFENDGIYAYLLTPESITQKKDQEVWQVVFLPNSDWTKIKEIKIHKNCCDQ